MPKLWGMPSFTLAKSVRWPSGLRERDENRNAQIFSLMSLVYPRAANVLYLDVSYLLSPFFLSIFPCPAEHKPDSPTEYNLSNVYGLGSIGSFNEPARTPRYRALRLSSLAGVLAPACRGGRRLVMRRHPQGLEVRTR